MDTATIINRLLEDEIGSIDAKADFMRLRPEIRLFDRADKKDVILIDDHGPLYVGTVGPKGSWWRIAWLAPKSSGRVQRLELAKYYPNAELAAEHLVNVMQPWWQTVLYRRAQDAYLTTESEDVDPKDYIDRALTMRSPEDLKRRSKNQVYVCHDPELVRIYGEPVRCWKPVWKGDGMVEIRFDNKQPSNFVSKALVQLQHLTPYLNKSPDGEVSESWGDDKATIDAEAANAEKPASKEQAEAGNYKKGHVSVQGIPIAIENAKGSTRSGTNKKGEKWSVTMPAHYGYVKKSESKDGDPVDVYIGETPSSMLVYVINQKKEDSGAFDEHKCMLGFKSKDEAIAAYDSAFSGDLGPKLRGEVISCTVDQFKDWLDKGDTEKPFKLVESEEVDPTEFIEQNVDAIQYDYLCQMCGHAKKLPFRDRTGRDRTIYQVWCEQCQDTEYFEISDEELAERMRKERQEQEAALTPEQKLARAAAVMTRRQQNESAVVIAKTLLDDE